ncbi:MAG TPA: alkaline phosphatase family protein [Candidatus Nitrosotalea sp.]|nr:alkaline phosphatase family protein [Candidatus Nitrosotalea sp.]
MLLVFWVTACAGRAGSLIPASSAQNGSSLAATPEYLLRDALPTPIQHVVIIFQENRTPDDLFQGLPGADIATYGIDSNGNQVPLRSTSLAAPWDLGHDHWSFVRDYDNGKMDGFDKGLPASERLRPFAFAPASEVAPYQTMAKQYAFADRMFATNRGPSFPAHLYIVSGTAGDATMPGYLIRDNTFNGETGKGMAGGCDTPPTIITWTIRISDGANGPSHRPCIDRPVLSDFLGAKHVTWRYYQQGAGAGLWHAFNAIGHVRNGKDFANVIPSPERFLTDVKNGQLAGVSWVMPADNWSDHPSVNGTARGPAWVAALVNAIGESKYWKSTAILITWDDWGGFYDHVKPPTYNGVELGFRVPLVIVSPYARTAYVSHVEHEFASLLVFTEKAFGIPKGSLSSTDRRADDLFDSFDFTLPPRKFVPISAPPFKPGSRPGSSAEDP